MTIPVVCEMLTLIAGYPPHGGQLKDETCPKMKFAGSFSRDNFVILNGGNFRPLQASNVEISAVEGFNCRIFPQSKTSTGEISHC